MSRAPVRGLTTIALLKAQYDLNRDHIGMFEPFVLDTIATHPVEHFTVEEFRDAFLARHGLLVPLDALSVLLNRAKNDGHVRRDAGRYFKEAKGWTGPNLQRERIGVERSIGELANALVDFSAAKGRPLPTRDKALELLLDFLEANQVAFLLDRPLDGAPTNISPADSSLIAAFITEECLPLPSLSHPLELLLHGLVLQNALLLKDINAATQRFENLVVYLDTRILFALHGLHGKPAQTAVAEGVQLLREAGAHIAVFEGTLDEVKRVLNVYERLLGSSEGIRQLIPGPLTTHLVTQKCGPADIKQVIALINSKTVDFGITIHAFPKRRAAFTEDEEALSKRIAGTDDVDRPRVVHDVDCIASILTLRAGHRSQRWEQARAVFTTTTGNVVRQAREWYQQSGLDGLPPVINYLQLTAIAWLKKPASAPNLKRQELVALCVSALRPSPNLWQAFLRHLKKLETTGELSSDEAVAIVANALTTRLLLELDHSGDADPDADTLTAVVERVRSDDRKAADEEIARIQREKEEAVAAERLTGATALQKAHDKNARTEFLLEQERQKTEQERLDRSKLQTGIERFAGQIAFAIGTAATILLAILIVTGVIVSGKNFQTTVAYSPRWWVYVVGLIGSSLAGSLGLISLFTGGSILKWKSDAERWLQNFIVSLIRPK